MSDRAGFRSSTFRLASVVALGLLVSCSGKSSSSSSPAPLIGATVVGFTTRAAAAGLGAGASVQVVDASTGAPVAGAVVTVNGSNLPYDAAAGAYEGAAPITARSPVEVSVRLGDRSYRASGQLETYPALSSPAPGDVWSALAPQEIAWQAGAPLGGASYAIGVVDGADPDGSLVWPAEQEFRAVPTTATAFQLQPGSLTGGDRVLVLGLVALGPFPGAADGSGLIVAGFDAVPISVTVGTPLASGPGPANLLASSGLLLWSDGEAPVKSVPAGGGPVARVVERYPSPESVKVVGSSLYWIAGEQLLRSALDGSRTTVLAQGHRTSDTARDLVVDGSAAYWINTVPDLSCSPACRWSIVRVPLDGGPSATLATAGAEIRGLAADATTLYWVQQGIGPVSADGNGATDSAVRAVPKAGGAAVTLVNGFQNGAAPEVPPGHIPGNWFTRGGLLVAGDQLYFADTSFDGYRVLRVGIAGGPVQELLRLVGSGSGFVRTMATDGTSLFWIDESSVKSLSLAGGAPVDLASGVQPTGLAVAAGRVVWSETACCSVRQNGSVRSVPVGGGAARVLADLLDNPASVTADAAAAFWVEGGPYGGIEGYGRVASAPHQGGGATTVLAAVFAARPPLAAGGARVVLADGWRAKAAPLTGGPPDTVLRATWSVTAVASDGVNVYALDGEGSLLRAPLAGGPTEVVIPGGLGPGAASGPLRIADGFAYWGQPSSFGGGVALRRVRLAGGSAETIATGLPALSDLAVDGELVYLAPASGQLQSLPASGGVPTVLGSGEFHVGARLAVDGERLYWIDATRLGRITLATGEEQVLAIGLQGDPALGNAVAVDAAGLYWIESGSGVVKRCDDR